MTNLSDIRALLQRHKQGLSEKYGVSVMAIFGSYVKEQQNENSDIDILVDFNKPIGIEFIDLANELEVILQNKVDLVSKNGIKPQYLKYIEPDLTYV
ncbi:MAG: nucleotidyltransferase family protein [Flavobacteriales bacterium]|nr:nucleotidyltransferase family protein [Flavobacteriales bacterium]